MRDWHDIVCHQGVTPIEHGEDGGAFFWCVYWKVIVSWGGGWDHVSVSRAREAPSWESMEAIKRLCFKPDECAMQIHPPLANYVNLNLNVLHIWRPQNEAIPMPPLEYV